MFESTAVPGVALGPGGVIYVVWPEHDVGANVARVFLASSADGGATWSQPTRVGSSNYGVLPDVAVTGRGAIGVQYYDLSRDKPGDGEWTSKWAFAFSRDSAATWTTRRIARRFDLLQAPYNGIALMLANYTGVASADAGFASVFTTSPPFTEQGRSDGWVARLVQAPLNATAGYVRTVLVPSRVDGGATASKTALASPSRDFAHDLPTWHPVVR